VIGAIVRASHELLGERVEGVLMPWDGKHSLESNWPNEDSGWMGETFRKSVPDFHWERFETWIEQIYETRDPELLLKAPLCTSANVETPTVKQPMVVGEELLLPTPKPSVDAPVAKDKEELDGTRPLTDEADAKSAEAKCVEEIETMLAHVEPTIEHQSEQAGRAASDHKSPQLSAMAVVEAAAKLVPMVGEGGKRVRKDAVHKAPKSSEKPEVAGDLKPKLDPRTWKPRKQREGEPPAEFKAYLVGWQEKRTKVAKRLGLKLE